MHAGLLRPDNSKTETWGQIEQVREECDVLELLKEEDGASSIAVLTSAEQFWVTDIERQSDSYDCDQVQLEYYSALRKLGVNIDFISVDSDFSKYSLIVAPCLPIVSEDFIQKCKASKAIFVFGPRSGSKTQEFSVPQGLAPGLLRQVLPLKVLSVETIRADCIEEITANRGPYSSRVWREEIELDYDNDADVLAEYKQGADGGMVGPAVIRKDRFVYIGTLTCESYLNSLFESLCGEANIEIYDLPADIRARHRGNLTFAFNYSNDVVRLPIPATASVVLGDAKVKPRGVTVWKKGR